MTDFNMQKDYFNYLKSRSKKSLIYRNSLVYPKLAKHLNGDVLDYGCGIGDFLDFYPNAVGVDINQYCVDYCNAKNNIAYIEDDFLSEQAESSFNCIILDNVYEHLDTPTETINRLKPYLKKDGVIVLGVPGKRGYECDSTHVHFYDELELVSSLAKAGLVKDRFFYTPLFKSEILSKMMKTYVLWGVFYNSKTT